MKLPHPGKLLRRQTFIEALPFLSVSLSPQSNSFYFRFCRLFCPSAELSSCVPTSFPLAYIKSDFLGSDIPSPPLGVSHLCLSLLCSVPTPTWMFVSLFIRFSYPACFSPIFFSVGVSALLGPGSLPLALTLAWPSGFYPAQTLSLLLLWSRVPWGKAEQRKNDA